MSSICSYWGHDKILILSILKCKKTVLSIIQKKVKVVKIVGGGAWVVLKTHTVNMLPYFYEHMEKYTNLLLLTLPPRFLFAPGLSPL